MEKKEKMHEIKIRFPKDEYEVIKDIAQENGMSISELVRYATLNRLDDHLGTVKFVTTEDRERFEKKANDILINLHRVEFELKRCGVNINQIAKDANTSIKRDGKLSNLDVIVRRVNAFQEHQESIVQLYGDNIRKLGDELWRFSM